MSFSAIKARCLREGVLYEDPDYPAVDSSLFYTRRPPRPVVWQRPKDIVSDPQLFVGGASRLDIEQGMVGDCWLLAVISCLGKNTAMLHKVIPPTQSLKAQDYCGAIQFHFWRFGEWVEVVIDDRLPTNNNKVVFLHSSEPNEFWSAFLEKAFAKMFGSYEALKVGETSEAMEDFTGGIAFHYDIRKHPDIVATMADADKRALFICCSIEPKPNEIEAKLDNGLVKGHAYSVTAVKKIRLPDSAQEVQLVRVRNPWGNEREWTGAWSDNSAEWGNVSALQRQELGITYDDNGEFWMSAQDFCTNFTRVEILQLPQPCNTMTSHHGRWVKGVSAGGCRNFPNTFHLNPQYRMTLTEGGEITVALMQKHHRKRKFIGLQILTMGFAVYKLEDDAKQYMSDGKLSKDYFDYHKSTARSDNFKNSREVVDSCTLEAGQYCIIPSTFMFDEEGEFLLRMFAKDSDNLIAEESSYEPQEVQAVDNEALNQKFKPVFERLAGKDGQVDAFELQQMLTNALKSKLGGRDVSLETSRSLVASVNRDRSGKLVFEQFCELWKHIMSWKAQFATYDKDNSNQLDVAELRDALTKLGFRLSTAALSAISVRYSNKQRQISIDDFLTIAAKVKARFEIYQQYEDKSFTLGDYLGLDAEESSYEPQEVQAVDNEALNEKFRPVFERLAGDDGQVDAFELQQMLTNTFKSALGDRDVSLETCRSLVASVNRARSGKLVFEEFCELWKQINSWKAQFATHDKDKSNQLDVAELRDALAKLGFRLSTPALSTISVRYSNKQGHISIDDFLTIAAKVKARFESYQMYEGKSFTLDDYLVSTIYS